MQIPKIVSSRLKATGFTGARLEPGHADTDLLAAFAEQTLSRGERDEMLSHLATCDGCRQILALALPPERAADRPLSGVEVVTTDRSKDRCSGQQEVSTSEKGMKNRWFGYVRPNLAWGALAAGVAVAASMVVLHPIQQQQASAPAPREIAAPAAKKSSETASRFSVSAAHANQSSIRESKRSTPEPKPLTENNLDVLAEKNLPPTLPPVAGTARAIYKAKPVPQTQPKAYSNSTALSLPAATWRIEAGSLQRSVDGGQSWQSPVNADHRVLCYASRDSEVWAGGKERTLLHSTDSGMTWSNVLPPQDLNGDIVLIDWRAENTGHLQAKSDAIRISTTAGEIWSSADGGTTWSRN